MNININLNTYISCVIFGSLNILILKLVEKFILFFYWENDTNTLSLINIYINLFLYRYYYYYIYFYTDIIIINNILN